MIQRPDLLRTLFEIGALKFGEFWLKKHEANPDLPPSPYYLNLRPPPKGNLSPGLIEELGAALWQTAGRDVLIYHGVVGVPEAGDFFANVIARLERVPQFFLAKTTVDGKRMIEPQETRFPHGHLLLCDDVLSGGHSKAEAAEAVRRCRGSVRDVVALIDREEGGDAFLGAHQIRGHVVWRISELARFYRSEGYIGEKQFWQLVRHQSQSIVGAP